MASTRADPPFRDSVRVAFQFLIDDFGFEITSETGDEVRYESPHVFAVVLRLASGPEKGMLIFHVGLHARPKDRLDLNELRRLAGATKPTVRNLRADLVGQLTAMASEVQKHGRSALHGALAVFDAGVDLRHGRTRGPWVRPSE